MNLTLDKLVNPDPLTLPHGLDNRYLNNQDALAYLQAECDRLDENSAREYAIRATRLLTVTKLLLDRFESEGIIITPRVATTNTAILDLVVRAPDKRLFALIIRSADGTAVTWKESRSQFFTKKIGQPSRRNDPLTSAMDELQTIVDLKKERHPLIGTTNAERNTPLIKAIVLAPGATISPNNPPTIRTTFGEADILKIKTSSITYVVEAENLTKFLLPPPKTTENST